MNPIHLSIGQTYPVAPQGPPARGSGCRSRLPAQSGQTLGRFVPAPPTCCASRELPYTFLASSHCRTHQCRTWSTDCRRSAPRSLGSGSCPARRCRTGGPERPIRRTVPLHFEQKRIIIRTVAGRDTLRCLATSSPARLYTVLVLYNLPLSTSGCEPDLRARRIATRAKPISLVGE